MIIFHMRFALRQSARYYFSSFFFCNCLPSVIVILSSFPHIYKFCFPPRVYPHPLNEVEGEDIRVLSPPCFYPPPLPKKTPNKSKQTNKQTKNNNKNMEQNETKERSERKAFPLVCTASYQIIILVIFMLLSVIVKYMYHFVYHRYVTVSYTVSRPLYCTGRTGMSCLIYRKGSILQVSFLTPLLLITQ